MSGDVMPNPRTVFVIASCTFTMPKHQRAVWHCSGFLGPVNVVGGHEIIGSYELGYKVRGCLRDVGDGWPY